MNRTAQIKVRMPAPMYRQIKRDAKRRGLTINAEILTRIEWPDLRTFFEKLMLEETPGPAE